MSRSYHFFLVKFDRLILNVNRIECCVKTISSKPVGVKLELQQLSVIIAHYCHGDNVLVLQSGDWQTFFQHSYFSINSGSLKNWAVASCINQREN